MKKYYLLYLFFIFCELKVFALSFYSPNYHPENYINRSHIPNYNQNRIQYYNQPHKTKTTNKVLSNYINLFNRNNNGSLTGYSVPITTNNYNHIPCNKSNSSNGINLFTDPSNNRIYYKNNGYYTQAPQLETQSSVKIIYD